MSFNRYVYIISIKKRKEEVKKKKVDLLGGFDEGVGRHNHENAIGENGDNDEEGEERMNENDDRHPPDGIERRQQPHGVRGAEPVNVFPFADHHKRLLRHAIQCKNVTTINRTSRTRYNYG